MLQIISDLYSDIDGFQISRDAIAKSDYYFVGMLYDEVTGESFFDSLSRIKNPERKTFIDLGSGVGKKVFMASLYGFSSSIGLEISPDVFRASVTALARYTDHYDPSGKRRIEFFNTDYHTFDLSCGDVLYLSLTTAAMEIELNGSLLRTLERLKPGVNIITTGLPIISPFYTVIHHGVCRFPRGEGDVFHAIRRE